MTPNFTTSQMILRMLVFGNFIWQKGQHGKYKLKNLYGKKIIKMKFLSWNDLQEALNSYC